MLFLKFIGTEGNGASNSNQCSMFEIGYGTASNIRDRVVEAINSLSSKYILWPDKEERRKISDEINKFYRLPNCVFVVDGTLFPLAFEPETEDAPDYSGRKYGYSLNTLIFCDNK